MHTLTGETYQDASVKVLFMNDIAFSSFFVFLFFALLVAHAKFFSCKVINIL